MQEKKKKEALSAANKLTEVIIIKKEQGSGSAYFDQLELNHLKTIKI